MIELGRRSLITGLGALIAAPAIVKVGSLMKLAPTEVIRLRPYGSDNLLTIGQITREAVQLFRNSNMFLREEQRQYNEDYEFMRGSQWDKEFAIDGAKIGSQLRIRLPNDFVVSDGPALLIQDVTERYIYVKNRRTLERVEPVAPVLVGAALAVAAAPVIEAKLQEPLTRRSLFRRRA